MHPSASGGAPSGAHNPMPPRNPNVPPTDSRSQLNTGSFAMGSNEQSSSRNPPLQGPSTSTTWYYPPGAPAPTNTKSAHSASVATSSAPMIGPTSSFYNAQTSTQDQSDAFAQQYQQWIDAFEGQQQRPAPFVNEAQQSPYQYASQYPSGHGSSQYATSSAGTVTQANVAPANFGDATGFSTTGFYNDFLTGGSTDRLIPAPQPSAAHRQYRSGSTPESTHQSFTNTPEPHYHQQPSQGQPHTAQRQTQPPLQTARQVTQPQPRAPMAAGPAQYVQQQYSQDNNLGYLSNSAASSTQSSSHSPSWSEENQQRYSTNPNSNNPSVSSSNISFKIHTPASKGQPVGGPPTVKSSVGSGTRIFSAATTASRGTAGVTKTVGKRKRFKKSASDDWSGDRYEGSDTESDDEDEFEGGISVGVGGFGVSSKGKGKDKPLRPPGACKHCKKLKMKCDFPRGENTCKRCKSAGHACVVEGRKPRTAPNKREYLLAQLRQKDVIIETLMKQVHNPYAATPLSIASYRMATSPSDTNNKSVLEWLDRLQSSVRDAGSKTGPQAFLDTRDKKGDEYSDHEDETQTEEQKDGDISDSEENPLSSEEKIQSSLPESHVPLGLIANLSLSNNKMSKSKKRKPTSKDAIRDAIAAAEEDYDDDNVGVANETYFMPGPATDLKIRATLIEQHSPPEILVHNLVTPKDVDNLFGIFYTRINPFVSLLDPVLHTPSSTFARCPFLFTVVCAISSRYYPEKSEIYPIAMHFAKHAAATALIDGWKSVELCQAYILMSIYAVPAMRWEEDRSWLYIGLAIRIATDLNLHNASTIKATSEKQEREILNKTRVWLICFNLDRSTATQFGKPSTIKEDYIVRNAKDWYSKSKYNHPYDIHLCAYSTLLQIVAKFHDEIFSDPSSPTGLNKRVDFRSVTLEHDRHLTNFHQEWLKKFGQESKIDDQGSIFRCSLLPFLVSYSRLVMFSFGFQQAFHRGLQDGDEVLFNKCLESAKAVLECMVDTLAPSGYMRYAPDGHFIFAAFASAFLLKLLRPEFSDLWKKEEELRVYELIGSLIKVLSSTKVAIDGRHTPNLYAKFLTALMTKHRKHDVPTVGRLQTQGPSGGHHVGGGGGAGGGPAPGGSGPSFSAPGPSGASGGVTGLASGGGPSLGSYGYASAPHPGSTTLAGDSHMMYMPENTFGIFNGRDFPMDDYAPGVVGTYPDEETLATMQAISNPAWWKDMMMPGFSWPDTSPSPPASGSSNPNSPPYHSGGGSGGGSNTMTSGSMDPSSYNDHYASNMPGSVGGKFGMFHAAYPPIQALH